jgi:UDP-N-acetylglucosamine 2-epimerase (non-hydrolysing)
MEEFGLDGDGLTIIDPLGYVDFMCLVKNSKFVMTDSGGMQEETTVLKKPCITLRFNTERPVTLEKGTNVLAGSDPALIRREAAAVLDGDTSDSGIPKLWDGHAAERIVRVLAEKSDDIIEKKGFGDYVAPHVSYILARSLSEGRRGKR